MWRRQQGRAVGLALSLGLLLSGCASSTTVGSSDQSCSPNFTPSNRLGKISAQQRGRGYGVAWGVYPNTPATRYVVDVYVDSRRVDHKDQNYPPHGSVNAADIKPLALFRLEGFATNAKGDIGRFFLTCRTA